ncbi:glycosyltransferase family 2 protein [Hymenobacter bucti]|uniref:Glycosyltransferase family 2 protein n=1 Tax=Hymenobacter bucti TaxID=1844114 RepID=A0ABW4QSG0_9BACT
MFVSIIVPNYNHAPYLAERIDSILAQTHQQFELILLDDCSTDDSRAVLERYRHHPRVNQVVFNTENSGTTFKQWAKGIELAQYEWIWLAESDDWCEPTLLETLIAGITPATCIAFCMSVAIKGNDILYVNQSKFLHQTLRGLDFVRERMLRITAISNASQAIFRKEVYYKIDKSFTTYKFSGDYLFWMLVAQHGEVYIAGKYLNYFRKHDKDVTSPSLKNGQAYREYLRIMRTVQDHAIISDEERVRLLILKFNELLWDNRVEELYRKEISALYHADLGNQLFSTRTYQLMGKRSYAKVLLHRLFSTKQ